MGAAIQFVLTAFGILLSFILFYNIKTLKIQKIHKERAVSIIIPARNEQINLPTLLKSLKKQSKKLHEIIVVNDASEDETAAIATSFSANVINIAEKPKGWRGKTYACFIGAKKASGDLLLFLDADLKLTPDAIEKLVSQYQPQSVLSVAPFHYTKKTYEQLSLFFNAIAIAAVGVCLPGRNKSVGLFGPVIMLERDLYFKFGGHNLVKNEVLEDYILGTRLREKGIKCNVFLGFGCISYEMYKGGLSDLIWGWSKNIADGALKTPLMYLLLSVLWISSYYTAAICFIEASFGFFLGTMSFQNFALYCSLYLFSGIVLYVKAKKIGRFSPISCILYIFPLIGFTLIFCFSLVLKFLVRKVKWKGRWQKI